MTSILRVGSLVLANGVFFLVCRASYSCFWTSTLYVLYFIENVAMNQFYVSMVNMVL